MRKREKINNKGYYAFVLIILILISIFLFNLFKFNTAAEYESKNVKANISTISTFDYSKVETIESRIEEIEDTESKGSVNLTGSLDKTQYMKIFKNSAVIGDSITEGLTAYGYLNADNVFCGIGASVMHGDDFFSSAAYTYPKFAFFSFGMNDMGNYTGHADLFIKKYEKLLNQFKKISPDTIIYVNSISIPSDDAIANNNILSNYKKFNRSIKKMCKSMKITYIDNTSILKDHEDYYAGDGIHVSSSYYPLWLNNMIKKAGL